MSVADQVTQLAAQCGSAYALTGGRRVFAWGAGAYGQLGDGTRTSAATPVLVPRVSQAVTVVAGCVDAYAIIDGAGSVMAWALSTSYTSTYPSAPCSAPGSERVAPPQPSVGTIRP